MSDLVEQEQAQHQRVAVASAAAGVLVLLGALFGQFVVLGGAPTVGLIQALTPALHGTVQSGISPHAAEEAFLNTHAIGAIFAALLTSVGTALVAILLRHLYLATRARRAELGNLGLVLGTYAPLASAVFALLFQLVLVIKAHAFVHQADHSQHAIDQIGNSVPLIILSGLEFASHFALAIAFVLIPLNAMRVGLLTRFMGVLGIISGVLFIFVQLSPLPVVQAFWLIALGVYFSGRGPQQLPPAWAAGVAIPWPSQQQLRAARADGVGAAEPPTAAPAPVPVPARTNPNASRKRKHKRR
ncbi:MAG: hypothetical protein NVSMB51_22590 [Solirubrobacteraceae bacterium]